MLTINTHIIKRGSLKEKIKNILSVIYNPAKAECMKKFFEYIQNMRKRAVYYPNAYSDSTKVIPPSEYDIELPILYYDELPQVLTEEVEGKWSKYINYYFNFKEEFINKNNETVTSEKKFYLTDGNSHIAYPCFIKDEKGKYSEKSFHYVIYVPEYGFYNVDDCIDKPTMSFGKKIYGTKVIKDKNLYRKSKFLTFCYRTITKSGNKIYSFLHTIDSIILCIRFPFLYPRNRFSGRHYNNWRISDYTKKLYDKANWHGSVRWPKDLTQIREIKDIHLALQIKDRPCEKNSTVKCWYFIDENGEEVVVRDKSLGITNVFKYHNDEELSPSAYRWDNGIYCWTEQHGWINLLVANSKREDLTFDHDDYESRWYHVTFSKSTNFYIKCVEFFHNYILGAIFCIPTHNELDALDEGWKRKFGIDLCRDIRKQLIKDKMLFSFRITQIKEKFGTLRFYTGPASKEIYSIIDKYEDISYSTCISCGEPAKYITSGWISPFCEHCIDEKSIERASVLDENGKIVKKASDEEDGDCDGE